MPEVLDYRGDIIVGRINLLRYVNELVWDFLKAVVKKSPKTLGLDIRKHKSSQIIRVLFSRSMQYLNML